jgi:cobalamin biosynthesis Mg chelatase CobN
MALPLLNSTFKSGAGTGDEMKNWRNAPMKRTYWIIGACLSLLLVGGLAMDVSAQQSAPPAAPSAPAETKPDSGATQPSSPSQATPPSGQMQQQPPSTNTQIESRSSEKTTIVERNGSSKIFGMDPMAAMIIGAVVLVVIVIGLVAMSRRTDEVHHTHHRV